MRLIDAELFKTCLDTYKKVHMVYLRFKHDRRVAEEAIDDIGLILDIADTVDAVPVVRCKDCVHKYYDGNQIICQKLYWCDGNNWEPSAEDFCSRGERKKDDSD